MAQTSFSKMKKVLRVLPLRFVFVIAIVLYVIILPFVCWNLPHSTYFRPGDKLYAEYLARQRAQSRLAVAETYFAQATKTHRLPFKYPRPGEDLKGSPSGPSLSVVILAVDRNRHEVDDYEPRYLSQSVHAAFAAVEVDQNHYGARWSNISIGVCNVDRLPDKFPEAKRLSAYLPVYNRPALHNSHLPCQPAFDFGFCLGKGVATGAHYLALIEDDMIMRPDGVGALWTVIQDRLPKRFHESIASNLGLVQLHTPMHRYSYSLHDSSAWLELLFITGLLLAVLFFSYLHVHCRPFNWLYNLALLGLISLLLLGFVWSIGRPHWLSAYHALTRHYRLGEPTVQEFSAVLMTRGVAEEVSTHIEHMGCPNQVDKSQVVNEFLKSSSRRTLAIYPGVVKHIGLYSTFLKDTINPHHLDD